MNGPRVAKALRSVADALDELADAVEHDVELDEEAPARKRARPVRKAKTMEAPAAAPLAQPSEMDRARAKKALKKLGYRVGA